MQALNNEYERINIELEQDSKKLKADNTFKDQIIKNLKMQLQVITDIKRINNRNA